MGKTLTKKRPSGLKYNIKKQNKSWFKKGMIPWNKGGNIKETLMIGLRYVGSAMGSMMQDLIGEI